MGALTWNYHHVATPHWSPHAQMVHTKHLPTQGFFMRFHFTEDVASSRSSDHIPIGEVHQEISSSRDTMACHDRES